jgi:urease accessory protein
MSTAPSTVIEADRSAATRIAVERAGERHRVFVQPGLIRAQTIRNDVRSCRIGLLATSALLLGGDRVLIEVEVGPGAIVELFDVAGTVAYHGRGQPAAWHMTALVARDAVLRWAGEPFVVADGADVLRTLELNLDASSILRLRETLVLGRSGEIGGRLRTHTGIRVGGEPVLLEDQLLDPSGLRGYPGMLGDHRVIDSMLAVGGVVAAPPPGAMRFGLVGGRGWLTRYLGSELAASPLNRWPEFIKSS